jgi:hypothetical protein
MLHHNSVTYCSALWHYDSSTSLHAPVTYCSAYDTMIVPHLCMLHHNSVTYCSALWHYDSSTSLHAPSQFLLHIFLWSSGQSSWLQIQMSGFDSQCYYIFWEVVGQERRPLNLVRTNEELLGKKSSGSGLETEITAAGIHHADHVAPSA